MFVSCSNLIKPCSSAAASGKENKLKTLDVKLLEHLQLGRNQIKSRSLLGLAQNRSAWMQTVVQLNYNYDETTKNLVK